MEMAVPPTERRMNTDRIKQMSRRIPPLVLIVSIAASLAASLALCACENVAGYTAPSLIRVIDASYTAPALNVSVENQMIAGNIGQGAVTAYGAIPASNGASIVLASAANGSKLLSLIAPLVAARQNSIFIADDASASSGYSATILADQQIPAAAGLAAFRFLNQATKTGAVDIYMVPADSTLADSVPLVTALPVGNAAQYISFAAKSVTMVVTPTGVIKPAYTSTVLPLSGGEVRTVLIMDSQLTSNPPVTAVIANDAGPAT